MQLMFAYRLTECKEMCTICNLCLLIESGIRTEKKK